MPRKPRIEFPNALYHVIARGNRHNKIFLTPKDFQKYLELIARYKKRHSFKLYAYALMSNHLHLLIETDSVPLSKTMQGLQQTYTQFFNWKYHKVGHLFQGRYKAIICQKDNYLLELVRYIHLNPIRTAVVENLSDYAWTGHLYYLGGKKDELIDVDLVLRQFFHDRAKARRYYLQFIREGIDKGHEVYTDEEIDKRILGQREFAERVLEHEVPFRNEEKKTIRKLRLDEILTIVCQNRRVLPEVVRGSAKFKEIVAARRLFILLARVQFGYSLREIALFLKISATTVTKNLRMVNRQLTKERGSVDETIRQSLSSLVSEWTECQA